jgi:hypothetical protein
MERSSDLRGWLWDAEAARVEAEIREELEAHLALAEEDLRGQGRSHDEARSEARARFGDLEATLRACRRERLGGRFMLVRIQWIVIALLCCLSLAMALYGRGAAVRAHTARDHAMMEAQNARALLEELRRRQSSEPVPEIVVAVGDRLTVQADTGSFEAFTTEVQRDGQALFTKLGWVEVAGLARPELERLLKERYAPYYEQLGAIYVIVKSPN